MSGEVCGHAVGVDVPCMYSLAVMDLWVFVLYLAGVACGSECL